MEQHVTTEEAPAPAYEKLYGKMNRLKAYGSVVLSAACAAMCVVEPIFLGFIGFPLLIAAVAPHGMRDLKKEFSKETDFMADAFVCIGRDMRRLGRVFGMKAPKVRTGEAIMPVEGRSGLADKSSRSDFGRGMEPHPVTESGNAPGTPANANAPAAPRKNAA